MRNLGEGWGGLDLDMVLGQKLSKVVVMAWESRRGLSLGGGWEAVTPDQGEL